MKSKNSSVENINYHPKSLSAVDYTSQNNSSIGRDIKLHIHQQNLEHALANNGIHTDAKHVADFPKSIG